MNAAMGRALLRDGSDLATYGMATARKGMSHCVLQSQTL